MRFRAPDECPTQTHIPSKYYLRVPVAERSAHGVHALAQSHVHW